MGNQMSNEFHDNIIMQQELDLDGSAGQGTQSQILHFEHTFDAKMVKEEDVANLPISPRRDGNHHKDGGGKVVKITLISNKILVTLPPEKIGQKAEELETMIQGIKQVEWDHLRSSVKITMREPKCAETTAKTTTDDNNNAESKKHSKKPSLKIDTAENAMKETYIFLLQNSIELEQELKARIQAIQSYKKFRGKLPPFSYLGMFAGPTKPKPFQRKRANLSSIAKHGSLPQLEYMRAQSHERFHGCGKPVETRFSRRRELALEHIHHGINTFEVLSVKGLPVANQMELIINYAGIKCSTSKELVYETTFENIASVRVEDRKPVGSRDNGICLRLKDGHKVNQIFFQEIFFQVKWADDCMHTIEFFWNDWLRANQYNEIAGSTHGRKVVESFTLNGSEKNPTCPPGRMAIIDKNGTMIDSGDKGNPVHVRRNSNGGRRGSNGGIISGVRRLSFSKPASIRSKAREYWNKVVVHQGWLLKKGGMSKNWVKRYFVLYNTSQGHILCYYSDYDETALFSETCKERNVVDICKVEYIRPKSAEQDTPYFSFDIHSIERDWTVCAENQEELQKWLQILAFAVDSDVAIVPDDEMTFLVKCRKDPTNTLLVDDYSTQLRVHAFGVSVEVCAGDKVSRVFYWPYTDLFKWSILSQRGKLGISVAVFASENFDKKQEFVFRTREANVIGSLIEYHIEKFMSTMHLKLEIPSIASATQETQEAPEVIQAPKSPLFKQLSRSQGLTFEEHHEEEDNTHESGWESEDEEIDLLGMTMKDDEDVAPESDVANVSVPSDNFFSTTTTQPDAINESNGSSSFNNPFDIFSTSGLGSADENDAKVVKKEMEPTDLLKLQNNLVALKTNPEGILFDSEVLQIFLKQQYNGSQGMLTLLFRNKSTSAFNNIVSNVEVAASSIRFQSTDIGQNLASQEQMTQQIRLDCMEPYDEEPAITLTFSILGDVHTRYNYKIPLPVNQFRFIQTLNFHKNEFLQQWQNIKVPEIMETVQAKKPINHMQIAQYFQNTLKLGFVQDLQSQDMRFKVLAFAGTLRTSSLAPNGKQISVGCLVRVEIADQSSAYRLTVRTVHPKATKSIFGCLSKDLAGMC